MTTHVDPFPIAGLLPKHETEATSFLAKYPHHDGRGTTIAILDTGVDPTAGGMQMTSTNLPKVLDIIDCTGAGDVAMSAPIKPITTVQQPGLDNTSGNVYTIRGKSGRELHLDPCWIDSSNNPSGTFRLGIKRAYDLWPAPLVKRMKDDARSKLFDQSALLQVQIRDQLNCIKTKSIDKSPNAELIADNEARLETLNAFTAANIGDNDEIAMSDLGPIYDVISWFDGKHWRVVLDCNTDLNMDKTCNDDDADKLCDRPRDLIGRKPLTNYRYFQNIDFFGPMDHCVYSVNVYDDGDIVSIVTLAGSHGSHCAAIAAAYHPEEPERNGLAPGAQIVSLKIGDTRLGSMETGPGLARAALAMVQHGVDLANMSYGEAAHTANVGRFIQLLRDQVIRQYNVIFVSSAGNEGPALTTVGAPGGTTSGVIGVGAHVNHAQMIAEYNLVTPGNLPSGEYTWSSRGPTYDGDTGVDIYAPGSAITSIPTYQLSGSQLMNGTSMSSPNACGNMALILSAWKANFPNVPLHVPRLLQALVFTGRTVETCPMKRPMIRIEKAWDHLREYHAFEPLDVQFELQVKNGGSNANGNDAGGQGRGIYLREPEETARAAVANVMIKPEWPLLPTKSKWPEYWVDNDTGSSRLTPSPDPVNVRKIEEMNERKLKLDLRLTLVPTASWIRCPQFVHCTNDGRSFPVEVDVQYLTPKFHFAQILAIDSTKPELGPIFAVPVSVCKSTPISGNQTANYGNHSIVESPIWQFDDVVTGPGSVERHFIAVPEGATAASISLSVESSQQANDTHVNSGVTPTIYLIRALQLVPGDKYALHGQTYRYTLGVEAQRFAPRHMRVEGGRTLEICLAQWWAAPRSHRLHVRVELFGLRIQPSIVRNRAGIVQGEGIARLDAINAVGFRAIRDASVSVAIEALRKYYAPSEVTISAMGERDITPRLRRVSQLLLNYLVNITDAATVTPQLPGIEGVLYDAPYSSYLLLIHETATKRLVATQDMYRHPIKLSPGKYTIRVQITSEDMSVLENLKSTCLGIDFPAPSSATKGGNATSSSLELYDSFANAIMRNSSGKVTKLSFARGDRIPMYMTMPGDLKDVRAGDQLLMKCNISYGSAKGEASTYPFVMTASSNLSSSAQNKEGKPNKTGSDGDSKKTLQSVVRDAKIAYLRSLEAGSESQIRLMEELDREYDDDLFVQQAFLDASRGSSKITKSADKVIQQIDRAQLALSLQSPDPEIKAEAEKKRDVLVHALTKKAIGIITGNAEEDDPLKDSSRAWKNQSIASELHPLVVELRTWLGSDLIAMAAKSLPLLRIVLVHYLNQKLEGLALRAIAKHMSEANNPNKRGVNSFMTAKKLRSQLLTWLHWTCWATIDINNTVVQAPSEWELF